MLFAEEVFLATETVIFLNNLPSREPSSLESRLASPCPQSEHCEYWATPWRRNDYTFASEVLQPLYAAPPYTAKYSWRRSSLSSTSFAVPS